MKALILAAGRGSRMGDHTAERPKCLVEVASKPLLDRQISALRAGGADEIGVVRGYRAEMIQRPGLVYFENPAWASTNMVSTLGCASAWLEQGPTVVSYSDIFYRGDLARRLIEAPGELVVAYDRAWLDLWSARFADPLSDAETFRVDAAGRLTEIGARAQSLDQIKGQYMGLLRFSPDSWRAARRAIDSLLEPDRRRLDMTSLLRLLLAAGYPISTLETSGDWGEVDSPSDAALYEKLARDGKLRLEA